jgi:hypothetical protein
MSWLPLDFYSPETFGFLSLYIYPHYSLARALMLWGILAFLRSATRVASGENIDKEFWKAGMLWLLTAVVQPLTGMVTGAVIGIYLLGTFATQIADRINNNNQDWNWWWLSFKLSIWSGMIPAPFILYNLIYQRIDPFVVRWTAQSNFESPHPIHYLIAYGLVLPFGIVGARELWKHGWTGRLPIYWVMFLPVLVYAPIGIQRRIPEGIWVAIVTLTVIGWDALVKTRYCKAGWFLSLTFISTAMFLIAGVQFASQLRTPSFRPSAEIAAFNYIGQVAKNDDVVLISVNGGNPLPAWASVRVLVGLGPESIGFEYLRPRIQRFYSSQTRDSERILLLKEQGVDYVFWGPEEKAYGNWNPSSVDYLTPIYNLDGYKIFKVNFP